MRENKIKCLLCEYAKMRAAVHEQRFWTELFLKCVGASLERDVSSGAQRSELVGIQSHRALLSALSTSVSVCSRKETNEKTTTFYYIKYQFSDQLPSSPAKCSKKWNIKTFHLKHLICFYVLLWIIAQYPWYFDTITILKIYFYHLSGCYSKSLTIDAVTSFLLRNSLFEPRRFKQI